MILLRSYPIGEGANPQPVICDCAHGLCMDLQVIGSFLCSEPLFERRLNEIRCSNNILSVSVPGHCRPQLKLRVSI